MDRIQKQPLLHALRRRELGLPSRYLASVVSQRALSNLGNNRYAQTVYKGHQKDIWWVSVQFQKQPLLQALCRRELGLPSRYLASVVSQRALSNLGNNRYAQTVYKGHQQNIWWVSVQYPLVVTASSDNIIKLWCLEGTKECRWTFNHRSNLKELKLLEDKTICLGQDVKGREGDLVIQAISCETGESVVIHKEPDRGNWRHCTLGRQKDIWIIEQEQITRRSLDTGKVIQKVDIDRQKYRGWCPNVKCWENFLVIFYKEVLAVHDLNKKENYEIECSFFAQKTCVDGARLFCVMPTSQDHQIRYQLFDVEKKTRTTLYTPGSDDPAWAFASDVTAVLHKEWIYLGYPSGHLVAANWANRTFMVIKQEQPISYLSLQKGILITGLSGRLFGNMSPGTLTFWNVQTLKQMGQIAWPPLYRPPILSFGKLVLTDGASLVVRDYSKFMDDDSFSNT